MAECRQWKKHGQKLMQYKGYGWKTENTKLSLPRAASWIYTVDEAAKTVTVLRVMQDGMDWQYIINRWLRENA